MKLLPIILVIGMYKKIHFLWIFLR